MKKKPVIAPAEGDMQVPKATANYQEVGRCFFCLRPIEALQPGGLSTRHTETKVPVGECEPAKRRMGC